jgi:hypothetical protein
VGLRIDVRVDVSVNGAPVGSGQLLDVTPKGGGGFKNALLQTIALTSGAVDVDSGQQASVTVAIRRTCSTPKGHKSGGVRLWYNGEPTDSGKARDAGSRLTVTIDGQERELFLTKGPQLSDTAGNDQTFAEMKVTSDDACPDRPYTAIGTWSGTLGLN